MLGDAARFARRDLGPTDGVEQGGLAVVDVAHDGDDRRPDDLVVFRVLNVDEQLVLLEGRVDHLELKLRGHEGGGVEVQGVVDRDHLAHAHELADDLGALHA